MINKYRQHAIKRMFEHRFHHEGQIMKCVICKHGETQPGTASITLERNYIVVVIREVPGEICDTCGEAYHSEAVTSSLLKQAEQAYRAGIDIDRTFARN